MADKPQKATFPAPPPFYQHFTRHNVDLYESRKHTRETGAAESGGKRGDTGDERALSYLTPPDVPHDGKWRAFGVQHELDAVEVTLQAAGIEQLFPDHPSVKLAPQAYLLSLARSLLTTFLATTGILAQNPTLYAKKVEDLRTIAINMHYLINQYRPHQARETLISLMEDRLDRLRAEIDAIQHARERLEEFATQIHDTQQVEKVEAPTALQVTSSTQRTAAGSPDLTALWSILDRFPLGEETAIDRRDDSS